MRFLPSLPDDAKLLDVFRAHPGTTADDDYANTSGTRLADHGYAGPRGK